MPTHSGWAYRAIVLATCAVDSSGQLEAQVHSGLPTDASNVTAKALRGTPLLQNGSTTQYAPNLFDSYDTAYKFFGHGFCLDGASQRYNYWWASSIGYYPEGGDLSACSCPECREICSQYASCVGYDLYCCELNGERCIAGASVLFDLNGRPSDVPPAPFSTEGYHGTPTSGPYFPGSGPIANANGNPNAKCYQKAV